MKLQGKTVVWPANLDSTKTRKHGRKLSKALAIQAPRLEEIHDAANRLSIPAEIVPAKSRPGSWWEKTGYAIVPRKEARGKVFQSLASEIRKVRSAKAAPEKGK